MENERTISDDFSALARVVRGRLLMTVGVILLSLFAALLEGIGIGFLLPIIEQASERGPSNGREAKVFYNTYQAFGIPFTLETIVFGVSLIITIRFTMSFFASWLRAALRIDYVQELQTHLFDNALNARVQYFDQRGSDTVLNTIITETWYAGQAIEHTVKIIQQSLLCVMYLAIAFYLAPVLTTATTVVLGSILFVTRYRFESGYSVGDRVAKANESIQSSVQAGTQGIRDVKLFGLSDEIFESFKSAVEQFKQSSIKLQRNKVAIHKLTELMTAITVFALIYLGITYSSLSLGSLGVFLFAMFRLGPRVSTLSNLVYQAEGDLPHLVRTQRFIDELKANQEPKHDDSMEELSGDVERIAFEDVSFTYDENEVVFDGLSFEVQRNELVAFVGSSGAGKSTIVSLLTRMYEPDEGRIIANQIPIDQLALDSWRSRVSVVRQNPYIFNDTLWYNVTLGNREASKEEAKRACRIARVDEFIDELPDGYETTLGDDGVRLSGGQRQRVAIARAILEDTDLLILDEATSDLDTTLEEEVHTAIEAMDRDYLTIVIAHRLSTVTNADCIFTLQDGTIVESGRHGELVSNGGKYADLYTAQGNTDP